MWGNEGLLCVWIFFSNSCDCVMSWKPRNSGFCWFSINIFELFVRSRKTEAEISLGTWFWLTWYQDRAKTMVPLCAQTVPVSKPCSSVLKLVKTLLLSLGTILRVPEWVQRHHICAATCFWALKLSLYTWLLTRAVPHWDMRRESKVPFSKREPLCKVVKGLKGLYSSCLWALACLWCAMILACLLYVFIFHSCS